MSEDKLTSHEEHMLVADLTLDIFNELEKRLGANKSPEALAIALSVGLSLLQTVYRTTGGSVRESIRHLMVDAIKEFTLKD